jgi:hypothetical protein
MKRVIAGVPERAGAAGDRFDAALATGRLVDGRPCTDAVFAVPGS